ncbi:MAG: hypothetical protein M3Y56_06325, partial [Armatimonadota bacterium]|nr:hypothetical protein [Armatimonadota bacterium]
MMKLTSRWVGAVVLGCLWGAPLWAAGAATDPVDSALDDVLSGKNVTGEAPPDVVPPAAATTITTAATSGTDDSVTPTTVNGEIVHYALARFDTRVGAYDTALQAVDVADASYRSYFNTYNRTLAAINAKIGGNQTIAMNYPDLEKLRDSSLAAAKKSLAEMQIDAVQAATLHAALLTNPLYAFGYKQTDFGKSRTDVTLFAKQLNWGATVNPNLRYVLHKGAATGMINSATTVGSTPTTTGTNASPTAPAMTENALAAQFKPLVIADLDTAVIEYDNLVRNTNNAETAYKQAQTAVQNGQKTRPRQTVTRTQRVRVGRRWVNRAVPNTALNNW